MPNASYKKIILFVVIILLLAGSYYYLTSVSVSENVSPDQSDAGVLQQQELSQQTPSNNMPGNTETLQLLSDLRSVTLSSDLFESKAFQSLSEFTVSIAPRPKGREDPLAPYVEFDVNQLPSSNTQQETQQETNGTSTDDLQDESGTSTDGETESSQ
jgi:hypothetical protein